VNRLLVRALAFAAAAPLLLAGSAWAAGNLVVNGSFEIGPDPGPFADLAAGSTVITGWTVGDFHIDYVSAAMWAASDGVRSLDLDGSVSQPHNGSIFQSFATTPGKQYLVSFDLGGNPWGLPLVKQVEVSAGSAVQVHSFDIGAVVPFNPPATLAWSHRTMLFTATGSTTTLTFRSLTPLSGILPDHGPALDHVVVEAVNTAWTNLGFALPGVAGTPALAGTGTLAAGSPGSLVLSSAAPAAPALLFIALGAVPTPFKCGTLVAVPPLSMLGLTTSVAGSIPLAWGAWPAGLSGLSLVFQYAVHDVGAPCGASLSNALRADVP